MSGCDTRTRRLGNVRGWRTSFRRTIFVVQTKILYYHYAQSFFLAPKMITIIKKICFSKKPKMRDVHGKMRECGKCIKMRDFPHDCGMVDTYDNHNYDFSLTTNDWRPSLSLPMHASPNHEHQCHGLSLQANRVCN